MKSYLEGKFLPNFDFRAIREKGAMLVTAGGKAPGPEPLKICLVHIQAILDRKKEGERLSPLECHDIICHIANSVLSGGIRRSACISFFDYNDEEMITCKYGSWWETNEQRGRCNNSAVLERDKITESDFNSLWERIEASGSGEPGVYWTNNRDMMSNPCCFTGNTKLLTAEGYESFESLEGKNFMAINKNGECVPASVWSTGYKEVMTLSLSDKTKITCTPNHIFLTVDNEEVPAEGLVGKRVMPFYRMNKEISEYTKYGFIQGDGALGRLSSQSHLGMEVYFGEKDLDVAEIFGFSETGNQYVSGYNNMLSVLGFSSENLPKRKLPSTIFYWKAADQLQFLKGLYSANGSVISKHRVSLKSSCLELILAVKKILENQNIACYYTTNKSKEVAFSNGNYVCKESYDLNITQFQSVLTFAEKINFIHTYKQNALEELIKEKAPKVLKSVYESATQQVFDFNLEDDTHWGVVEGVIAHNCEIALRPNSFCNLCEVNVSDIVSQEDLCNRVGAAAFFGTLQAGFTDFHYLRPIWKQTTDKDALLGIGMTGIGSGEILKYNLEIAAVVAKETNSNISAIIGINEAARITCVKPSGTTSLVLGTSSGIHAWHAPYYLRTMRFNKNEDIAAYLMVNHPEMCEDDILRPKDTVCIRIPAKAPEGSIFRNETAIDTLERVKKFSKEWILPGHIHGDNTHNVSVTVSIDKNRMYKMDEFLSMEKIREMYSFGDDDDEYVSEGYGEMDIMMHDLTNHKYNEWTAVGRWMWENKNVYNGISVLPYDNGSYVQAPFEDISEEEYNRRIESLKTIDLTKVMEIEDTVNFNDVQACGGGQCEINI